MWRGGGGGCSVLEYEDFIKIGFIFLEQFQVPVELRGVRGLPYPACAHTCTPPRRTIPTDGAFVTTGGPAPTCHYHLQSGVHAALTLGAAPSVGLDGWIITCIHHFGVTQSRFTAP